MDKYDALLMALQRRLVALAKQTNPTLNDEEQAQLRQLIALLYVAQREDDGFVAIDNVGEVIGDNVGQNVDNNVGSNVVQHLHHVLPQLIGDVDALSTPIVYCPPFVAFRRAYAGQKNLATYLASFAEQISPPTSTALQRIDWAMNDHVTLSQEQQLAAITVATLPLTIITGGAGTGKTSTLTKALELMLLDNPQAKIILSAPTGKAADRLNQSLHAQLSTVNREVRAVLAGLQATTLHRLLGISENTGRAFHHVGNPVRCNIIAIDEASMVGGELFTLLRNAVLPQTKILLLGDANQLPPIDSTPFFNEVSRLPVGYSQTFCDRLGELDLHLTPKTAPLPNAICHLTASRRFKADELVGQAALAVLDNDGEALMQTLNAHQAHHNISNIEGLYQQLKATYPTDPTTWLQQLPNHMILCANRQGILGSEAINDYLDQQFYQQFATHAPQPISPYRAGQTTWYTGRRIMISRNDYNLSLYNGDIGYCEWSESNQRFDIVFENKHRVPVDLIEGNYTLAFAISIHKSQGSEYQHVDIILGHDTPDSLNRLVSKSLLYTAITRAKKQLRIFGDVGLINRALSEKTHQQSPLRFLIAGE